MTRTVLRSTLAVVILALVATLLPIALGTGLGRAAADETGGTSPVPTADAADPAQPVDPATSAAPATPANPAPSPSKPAASTPATSKPSKPKPSKPKPVKPCRNELAQVLHKAGFRGEDLREAWAISMRESRGRSIGPGNRLFNGRDYGIFQLNRPTFGGQTWWNTRKILTKDYSAKIAYKLSKGGRTWVLWGLDGDGRPQAHLYRSFGWSSWQIQNWIVQPYQRFYRAYPC